MSFSSAKISPYNSDFSAPSLRPHQAPISETFLDQLSAEAAQSFVAGELRNTQQIREMVKIEIIKAMRVFRGQADFEENLDQQLRKYIYHDGLENTSKLAACLDIKKEFRSFLLGEFQRKLRKKVHQELTAEVREQLKAELSNPNLILNHSNDQKRYRSARRFAREFSNGSCTLNRALEGYFLDLHLPAILKEFERQLYESLVPSTLASREAKHEVSELGSEQSILDNISQQPDLLKAFGSKLLEDIKADIRLRVNLKTLARTRSSMTGIQYANGYVSYPSLMIGSYDATRIPGTHLIASQVPKDELEAAYFISKIVLAEEKGQPPVTDIVAFGNCINSQISQGEFIDYFGIMQADLNRASIRKLPGVQSGFSFLVETSVLKRSPQYKVAAGQAYPQGIIHAEIAVREVDASGRLTRNARINYLVIALPEREVLNLENEAVYPGLKNALIQVAERSTKNCTVVQCADGLGRSGYFVYMLELLKNASLVFGFTEPEGVLFEARKILKQIRDSRPMMVLYPEQEEYALRHAALLNTHFLELKKIQAPRSHSAVFLQPMLMTTSQDSAAPKTTGCCQALRNFFGCK